MGIGARERGGGRRRGIGRGPGFEGANGRTGDENDRQGKQNFAGKIWPHGSLAFYGRNLTAPIELGGSQNLFARLTPGRMEDPKWEQRLPSPGLNPAGHFDLCASQF